MEKDILAENDIYEFIKLRIVELRADKTARGLSLEMNKNENYINQIESGIHKPSFSGLNEICRHLGVTMSQFFSVEDIRNQQKLNRLMALARALNDRQLDHVIETAELLNEKNQV